MNEEELALRDALRAWREVLALRGAFQHGSYFWYVCGRRHEREVRAWCHERWLRDRWGAP